MDFVKKTIGEMDCDSIYLPVGLRLADGNLARFVTLQELDGDVEEQMADAKVRDNAGKIITAMLFGIVTSIEGKNKVTKDDIRNLSTVDRDFLIAMSHKVSSGNIVKWTEKCPYCPGINDIVEDLDKCEVRFLPTEYDNRFTFELPKPAVYKGVSHSDVSIVLPNGWVQEKVAPFGKSNPAQATTTILQMITHRLGTLEMPIDVEVFRKMSTTNRRFINKYIEDMRLGIDFTVTEYCAECGEKFTTTIPVQALLGE